MKAAWTLAALAWIAAEAHAADACPPAPYEVTSEWEASVAQTVLQCLDRALRNKVAQDRERSAKEPDARWRHAVASVRGDLLVLLASHLRGGLVDRRAALAAAREFDRNVRRRDEPKLRQQRVELRTRRADPAAREALSAAGGSLDDHSVTTQVEQPVWDPVWATAKRAVDTLPRTHASRKLGCYANNGQWRTDDDDRRRSRGECVPDPDGRWATLDRPSGSWAAERLVEAARTDRSPTPGDELDAEIGIGSAQGVMGELVALHRLDAIMRRTWRAQQPTGPDPRSRTAQRLERVAARLDAWERGAGARPEGPGARRWRACAPAWREGLACPGPPGRQ